MASRPHDRAGGAGVSHGANGLAQADLAEEIGAQPYVSDILRGKKTLTSEQIGKLAKRFGVSPAVFFPS